MGLILLYCHTPREGEIIFRLWWCRIKLWILSINDLNVKIVIAMNFENEIWLIKSSFRWLASKRMPTLNHWSVMAFHDTNCILILNARCLTFDLKLICVKITSDISNCFWNLYTKLAFMMIRVDMSLGLKRPESALTKCQIAYDPCNSCKSAFPGIWFSIIKIRRSWIIFIMENHFTGKTIYLYWDGSQMPLINILVIAHEWCNTLIIHYIKRIWWGI